MLIRLAQETDLPAIVEIYNQAIQTRHSTGDLRPQRVEDRRAWFREHLPEKYPIYVAEVDGQLRTRNLTWYGGHDPEDYQHAVGDPPTASFAPQKLSRVQTYPQ